MSPTLPAPERTVMAAPWAARPVPRGPRAYRRQVRALGPFAALLPAAAWGALAAWWLGDHTSTLRGAAGFVAAILAAPGLVVAGAPLAAGRQTYTLAIAASIAMWLVVGLLASRRATRSPAPKWGDFWREYAWFAVGIWTGAVAAFVVADLVLGGALR